MKTKFYRHDSGDLYKATPKRMLYWSRDKHAWRTSGKFKICNGVIYYRCANELNFTPGDEKAPLNKLQEMTLEEIFLELL